MLFCLQNKCKEKKNQFYLLQPMMNPWEYLGPHSSSKVEKPFRKGSFSSLTTAQKISTTLSHTHTCRHMSSCTHTHTGTCTHIHTHTYSRKATRKQQQQKKICYTSDLWEWMHLLDFQPFVYKGDNFCDFLFGFLHNKVF